MMSLPVWMPGSMFFRGGLPTLGVDLPPKGRGLPTRGMSPGDPPGSHF